MPNILETKTKRTPLINTPRFAACLMQKMTNHDLHEYAPLTAISVEQQMSSAELRRKSISLDCDTIYFSDVLGSFRACESGCGSSFYFEDEGDKVRQQSQAPTKYLTLMSTSQSTVFVRHGTTFAVQELHMKFIGAHEPARQPCKAPPTRGLPFYFAPFARISLLSTYLG